MNITSDHIMTGVLALIALAIVVSIVRQHMNEASSFNLFDLIMEDNKLSMKRVFAMGGFALHYFAIVYWLLQGTMKSEDMLIFSGIWVTPYLANIIKGDPPSEPKP